MASIFGIDVSGWDSTSDWNSVLNQGVKFVFVKASENTYSDSKFTQHWQGSKSVGMYRGAFHFFHSELDNAAQQAAAFIQAVGVDKGELPPVLDLEPVLDANKKDISPSGNTLLTRAKTWLDAVESAFGRKPMIYTSTSYATAHAVNASWLANYPLWIAQYPWMPGTHNEYTDPGTPPTPGGIPQQPPVFQPWIIWQYTESGRLNAFSGGVDFDYFKGSLADLAQFAGTSIAPTITYTMQAGDTLAAIALKFNVSLTDLVNLNNAVLIQPGKVLNLPSSGGPIPKPPQTTYVVKPGDTLTAIAAKFGTTVAAIVAANNITNPNLISVGQMLVIPA
jgi:GH25 family lysozyme M1 (1,4-beta-N-acetylmuramidase)